MAFCGQRLARETAGFLICNVMRARSRQGEYAGSHPLKPYSTRCHSDIIGNIGLCGSRWRTYVTEPWLSADDIASHLGVTKDTVYTWIAEKDMPAHKVGRLWKFQASEVDDWVRRGGAAASDDAAPR